LIQGSARWERLQHRSVELILTQNLHGRTDIHGPNQPFVMTNKKQAIIADLAIFPVGEGTSVGDYVKKAFEAMAEVKGVRIQPTAMSTIIETDDISKVITALERAHGAILSMGAKRVYIALRVDHRLDNPHDAEYKVGRMTGRIRKHSSRNRS